MNRAEHAGPSIDRRAFLAAGGAAAAAGLAQGAGLGAGDSAIRRTGWSRGDTVLPWQEVAPGVHAMIELSTGGNAAVFVGDGGVLVVDSKYPAFAPALRHDALALAGLPEDAPVDLVNTHHHGDHTAGNIAFVDKPGISLAHKNAVPRIESQVDRFRGALADASEQAGEAFGGNGRLVSMAGRLASESAAATAGDWRPALGVTGEVVVTVGDSTFHIRHFGSGHTDNDLVVRAPHANVVHTGDLVFNGFNPFFDQNGGVSAAGWLESLAGVLELCDAETRVVPGHGPAGDRSIVRTQVDYIERLIDAVRTEIAKGTSRDDVAAMSFSFMEGLGFDQLATIALGAVYDELTGE